jgi:hypothetical protein
MLICYSVNVGSTVLLQKLHAAGAVLISYWRPTWCQALLSLLLPLPFLLLHLRLQLCSICPLLLKLAGLVVQRRVCQE